MGAGEFALLIPVLAIFFGGIAALSRTAIGKAIARRIGGEVDVELPFREDLTQMVATMMTVRDGRGLSG